MSHPQTVGSGWGWDGSHPPTSPIFTGTLRVDAQGDMERTTRLLLSLQNGFRFRKLVLCRWNSEEHLWAGPLVDACSGTLECVDIQVPVRCGAFLQLLRLE